MKKTNVLAFLFEQLCKPELYLLFFATLTMTLMYAWRGYLRNQIFWNEPRNTNFPT